MLNLFSGEAKLSLIPKVWPSLNINKSFLQLSEWDDELLATPKIITFLVVPSSKLHEPALLNVTL